MHIINIYKITLIFFKTNLALQFFHIIKFCSSQNSFFSLSKMHRTANPVWFINSRKSFSIGSIPISNYMFPNRIINFRSKGVCLAGSSNARQKHKFPNGIIKLQFENYDSFLNYKLFIGLIKCSKEKETNLKFLNFYWKLFNIWESQFRSKVQKCITDHNLHSLKMSSNFK